MSKNNLPTTEFTNEFSHEIWDTTYKHHTDKTVDDTMYRVAKGIAQAETTDSDKQIWTDEFYEMLAGFKVTTGGRIYSNAGTDYAGTTLFNCYTTSYPEYDIDSIEGILELLKIQSKTLKSEGGWGCNFSHIRPRGAHIVGIGAQSPGVVKFMELFDASSDIITSGSGTESSNKKTKKKIRKGAQMAVLDVTHPSIFEFITAKQTPGRLTKFNMSVNCTDEFMDRVKKITQLRNDGIDSGEVFDNVNNWDLIFPDTTHEKYKSHWNGDISVWQEMGYPVIVYETTTIDALWNAIMKSTYTRNEPGVLFLDAANRYASSTYHEAEKIRATNPCLPADTWIHTSNGPKQIKDLIGVPFDSRIDGIDHPSTPEGFFKTATKQLVKIETYEGYTMRLTDDHRVRKINKFEDGSPISDWCEAGKLSQDDLLLINNHESNIEWPSDIEISDEQAYTLGLLIGDGTISKSGAITSVWTETDDNNLKMAVSDGLTNVMETVETAHRQLPHRSDFSGWVDVQGRGEYRIKTTEFSKLAESFGLIHGNKKITNDIERLSSKATSKFLSGLFDADGSVQGTLKNGVNIRLSQSNIELLEATQRMLLRLGIFSIIYKNRRNEMVRSMPDGKGGYAEYKTKANHELIISKINLVNFSKNVGFIDDRKQDKLLELLDQYKLSPRKNNFSARVKRIVVDIVEDVYDASIPGINSLDTMGFHAHNCGEQQMPSGLFFNKDTNSLEKTSGICCLSSINLTKFINEDNTGFDLEALRHTSRTLVRFLDNVNTVASTPLAEYDYARDNKRRIGIGVMGWGSALYMLKIRFGSEQAEKLKEEMMGVIVRESYMASIDLAEERGMYKYCIPEEHAKTEFIQRLGLSEKYINKLKKVGIRNSSINSVQPTGNTSIFANIVSGGLEPVFMPEYVRTSIVSSMPTEIKDVCPKWYEGEFHETDLFKFAKEGDETILKGEMNGTVYKIDKNRGLVKETLCEDYGVAIMKQRGEWDADADWACSTTDLSVDEHLTDLKGFAYWIDSSMSKTVNLPEDYDYEDFKKLYLDGYNSGVLKGLTSYRMNSMTSVLSAKEESGADDSQEEIILDDVKLPESSPAEVKVLRSEGKKLYVTVSMLPDTNRPFALFVKSNYAETSRVADEAVELLLDLAVTKGIPQIHIDDQVKKMKSDNNINKVARLVSLNLRHGVFIRNIVAALDKSENAIAGSFTYAIKKLLGNYIKEGEVAVDSICQDCGASEIVYREGCKSCTACGSSACG